VRQHDNSIGCDYTARDDSADVAGRGLPVLALVGVRAGAGTGRRGAEELGVPLPEHISFCIEAMRDVAEQLGLEGIVAGV